MLPVTIDFLPALVYKCSPSQRPSVKYHLVVLCTFYCLNVLIKFMASVLQQIFTEILQNDYMTRMLIDLGASRPLVSVFSLVLIISAVGYDYSK